MVLAHVKRPLTAGNGRPHDARQHTVSPLKALGADTVLAGVIVGGFVLLGALITDGVVTGDFAAVAGIAGVLGTLITGAISALVVLAVKDSGSTKDPP